MGTVYPPPRLGSVIEMVNGTMNPRNTVWTPGMAAARNGGLPLNGAAPLPFFSPISDYIETSTILQISLLLEVDIPTTPPLVASFIFLIILLVLYRKLLPTIQDLIIPSVYIVSANSLAKQNAKQLLIADVNSCNAENSFSHLNALKSRHYYSASNIGGFSCLD